MGDSGRESRADSGLPPPWGFNLDFDLEGSRAAIDLAVPDRFNGHGEAVVCRGTAAPSEPAAEVTDATVSVFPERGLVLTSTPTLSTIEAVKLLRGLASSPSSIAAGTGWAFEPRDSEREAIDLVRPCFISIRECALELRDRVLPWRFDFENER